LRAPFLRRCPKTDTVRGQKCRKRLNFVPAIATREKMNRDPGRLKILPKDIARLPAAGLVTIIVVGFLGRYFPGGDSLAVIRPEAAILLLPAAALAFGLGARRTPVIALVVATIAAISILRFAGSGAVVDEADFTIRQHNMLFSNTNRGRLVQDFVESGADVIAVQEVGYRNTEALREVATVFPSFHFCRYERGGVAILARDIGKLLASGCARKTEIAWMQVETAAGPVTFASIHMRWPWPKPQYWQVGLVEEEIAKLPKPIVLAGDFNMVPWAAAVDRIAAAADGVVGQGLSPTYFIRWPWPSFRIDNVIAPRGADLNVERTAKIGSDHHGLVARIKLR